MRIILLFLITFFITIQLQAQQTVYFNLSELFPIQDFSLTRLTHNGQTQLKIIAELKDANIDKSIEGKYEFVINGKESYFNYISNAFQKIFGFEIRVSDKEWKTGIKMHPDDFQFLQW